MKEEPIKVYCDWCEQEQPCRLTSPIEADDKWEEVECSICGEVFAIIQKNGKWVNYDEIEALIEKRKAST